jgi:Tfp pilus assembly protein PilN
VRRTTVNLARRPFVNSRPVARAAVALWVAGAVLAAANFWFFRSYFVGSNQQARRLAESEQSLTAERARLSELEAQLAGMGLGQQNETVAFLNRKIAARAFSWSRLFERLAALLPNEVRLLRLKPETAAAQGRRAASLGGGIADGPVRLALAGEAKSDEALLALVDALFADPAFRNPDPARETRNDRGVLSFDLTVEYLPAVAGASAAPSAAAPDAAAPASAAPAPADATAATTTSAAGEAGAARGATRAATGGGDGGAASGKAAAARGTGAGGAR